MNNNKKCIKRDRMCNSRIIDYSSIAYDINNNNKYGLLSKNNVVFKTQFYFVIGILSRYTN